MAKKSKKLNSPTSFRLSPEMAEALELVAENAGIVFGEHGRDVQSRSDVVKASFAAMAKDIILHHVDCSTIQIQDNDNDLFNYLIKTVKAIRGDAGFGWIRTKEGRVPYGPGDSMGDENQIWTAYRTDRSENNFNNIKCYYQHKIIECDGDYYNIIVPLYSDYMDIDISFETFANHFVKMTKIHSDKAKLNIVSLSGTLNSMLDSENKKISATSTWVAVLVTLLDLTIDEIAVLYHANKKALIDGYHAFLDKYENDAIEKLIKK